jgi:RNA polymerase sigma-70 factor (ECF subfamily)
MNTGQDPIAPFRGRLLGLAYRMLGSRADADDVLQDAYLRISDAADIANLEAYLVTTVTRLCIDRLKSAQVRRETYIGPWLPEPVLDAETMSPHTTLELAEDLSFALMLVLERLSPPERAAFLLHDIFDIGFAEIAAVLDRSEPSCRQLASRARRAIKTHRPATPVPIEQQGALLASFASAVSNCDVAALMAVLREDAILLSDGGGFKLTALNPILGADRIARYFAGSMRKFTGRGPALRHQPRMINGALGVVSYLEDVLDQVLSLHIDGDRIAAIYIVRNPYKLAHLRG